MSALRPIRFTLMIQCFFDDSGKEADSPFVVVAGYIARDIYWQKFNDMWKHMLMKHGTRQVHMKDLIGLHREYKRLGWDETKRNEVISDCASLIKHSELIGIGVAVDARHYVTLSKERRKRFGSVQEFCFQRVVRMLMDIVDKADVEGSVSVMVDFDTEYVSGSILILSDRGITSRNGDWRLSRSDIQDFIQSYKPPTFSHGKPERK
jgi:hypothetical protein